MRRALPLLLAAAVAVVVVIGLSQAGGEPNARSDEKLPPYSLPAALKALRGSPPALAALHADANRILGGGVDGMQRRLRRLRGHPVVVNKWASWCGPCRLEFPIFQRVAAKRGREVAFLGLNSGDNREDATGFLADFPVPFPSYEDPQERIARNLGVPANYPITLFLDDRGRKAFVHQGQYKRMAELEADIDRYLTS